MIGSIIIHLKYASIIKIIGIQMNLRAMKKNKINVGSIIQSIFLIFLTLSQASAQTQGSLIPNGKTVFLDNNGNPLSSGKVYFYTQGTTTPKTTYQDINQTIPNTNPVILDAAGRPSGSSGLWGIGTYRQIVQDKNSNQIWDVTTSTSGTGGTGPTATGDGDAVGTIKPWGGISAPNQYMFTYGQTLNRVTYATLFNTITSTQGVFCVSGSPILTGLSDTASFWIGMSVEASCVPAGFTTIISKTSNSVTLAVNANTSVNTTAIFFPWGNGNHSTTFNLPDYRGLIPIGNNIMGGVASTNISDANFGAAGASSAGAQGGAQTTTLLAANLPPYTPAGTIDPPTVPALANGQAISAANGSVTFLAAAAGATNTYAANQMGLVISGAFHGTPAAGQISTPIIRIPPVKTVNFVIKVTPDTAFSGTGVTSLGGMTGDITCGSGLTCAGNIISVNIIPPSSTIASFADRASAIAATISGAILSINLEGYTTSNDGGGGMYNKLSSPPTPKAWHLQSADGAWWQLASRPIVPKQVGAILDGTTDDSAAMQAWLDYGTTFSVTSYGQSGTAKVPTTTLTCSTGAIIDGGNVLTIKRTTDTVLGLLECNSASNIIVQNLKFDTTAGFSSTSSNTVANGAHTYTVPAGLTGLVNGQFVQVTANATSADRVNYMIAQITSYSGTTLVTNSTTSVGSGTFTAWLIDVYPINGNLAESNIALRFDGSNNVLASNNIVNNRFYNAFDSRNTSNIKFEHNTAIGYVNRGIHMSAYNAGLSANNIIAKDNYLNGNSFSQYGINTSASDGATVARMIISNNQIVNTNYQGIIIAGGVTYSTVSNNSISLSLATNGVALLIEDLVGTSGNQLPQFITASGNTIASGLVGVELVNVFYSTMTGNVVSGSGVGFLLSGSATQQTLYNTLTGNVANTCVSHGYQFTGSGANGVFGTVAVGNSAISNGGWGFISDANTGSSNYSANVSIANGSGAYSFAGAGNVVNGTNL